MFGDYVSLYLAALREVDPCNVDPIVDIKARIRRYCWNEKLKMRSQSTFNSRAYLTIVN